MKSIKCDIAENMFKFLAQNNGGSQSPPFNPHTPSDKSSLLALLTQLHLVAGVLKA